MNIDRYNYEEFFILYVDNELDGEGRREVEAFAEQNPDLKAELDILMQSKLTPDTQVSFTDKDSLMRFGVSSISLANCDEWLTAYVDNELSEAEKDDAEKFIAGNPSIQRELDLLQRAKLQPETIVFPYKDSLYHKEEKAHIISIRWWRIAVAAVLLLGISTTGIVLMNNKNDNSVASGIARNSQSTKQLPVNDASAKPSLTNPVNKNQATTLPNKKDDEREIKTNSNALANRQNTNEQKEKVEQFVEPKSEESLITNTNAPDKTNMVATQTGNANNQQTDPGKDNIASSNNSKNDPPVLPKEDNIEKVGVTTLPPNTSNKGTGSQEQNPDVQFASAKSGGGLRGFLRKVTRTLEKRTNIKATDDDDRLLIAGLAIKMN